MSQFFRYLSLVLIVAAFFSLITACTKSNPLLGKWQQTRVYLLPGVGKEIKYDLIFEQDAMILKDTKIFIDYKFKENGTVLLFSDGYFSKVQFVNEDLIIYTTLRGRPREFSRK